MATAVVPDSQIRNYDQLIAKEATFWGSVQPQPDTPQIWHDPVLDELFFGKERRELQDKVLERSGRTLDIGCGEGAMVIYFAGQNIQAEGIDVSPERIERAKQAAHFQITDVTLTPTFRCGDLNVIELPPSTYDSITAQGSLHHVLRLDFTLDEVHKALKPNGHFLVYDYIGMGPVRKILASFLYSLLPTYKTYRQKLKLAPRLPNFLASEQRKRQDLTKGKTGSLHRDSPFEEISQRSIIDEIRKRFRIDHISTHLPFFFYLVAKVRVPRRWKYSFARLLKSWDDVLVRHNICRGSYVFIVATRL